MLFGEPTTLAEVLAAVSDRLVAAEVMDASKIYDALGDDAEVLSLPSGGRYVAICPESGTPIVGDVTGGGNDDLTIAAVLRISLAVQLNTDPVNQDRNWLRDETNGVLAHFKKILDALHLYAPPPAVGTQKSIFAEPMRLQSFRTRPRRRDKGAGYGLLPAWWEVKYRQKVG